ncbi:hypothetical protein SAMD00023353_0100810 [Rosellinia necatrix]|uniref:Uncharacterized protein n=1 Tax=Rosellinia necatrix TaxID=77044 RepID=A0A1S8A4N2_ROSNE|nr:hypothetical protein SAMD00023353_0100810 [Rosellinia necatrix]
MRFVIIHHANRSSPGVSVTHIASLLESIVYKYPLKPPYKDTPSYAIPHSYIYPLPDCIVAPKNTWLRATHLTTTMATIDTVDLGPPHPPREESLRAFAEAEADLKRELLHLKHTYLKHEPEYFAAVQHLSDAELTSFGGADLESVRVAQSAYGIHLLGRVRIPALPADGPGDPAYLHVRLFVSDEPAKLHSIHTEERDEPDGGGGKRYRAIFTADDPLEWFDT